MKARAAQLVVAAGLLLAGCGIPTTGVVEAGEAASGVHSLVTLYFVRGKDGRLATVQRRADKDVDPAYAVGVLLNGLATVEEQKLGLTTYLPPLGPPTVRTGGGAITVALASPGGPLSTTAVAQVVCTALAAGPGPAADPAQVTVTVDGVPAPEPHAPDGCQVGAAQWSDVAPAGPRMPSASPTAPGGVSGG